MSRKLRAIPVVLLVIFCLGAALRADEPIGFTEIAATGGPSLSTGTPYVSLGVPTDQRDGGDIFFQAEDSTGVSGVYIYTPSFFSGTPASYGIFVDSTMSAPSGGNYVSFSSASGGNGFPGALIANSSDGQEYLLIGNNPAIIQTAISLGSTSDSSNPFSTLRSLSFMGGNDVFGGILTDSGIYFIDSGQTVQRPRHNSDHHFQHT